MRPKYSSRCRLAYRATLLGLLACLAGCAVVRAPESPAQSASEPLPLTEDLAAQTESLPLPTDASADAPDAVAARQHPLIERALSALGTRYRYGGSSLEKGFDCSGFVRWIYQDIAAQLPRSAQALSEVEGPLIAREDLRPADVMFFRINRSRSISHVGMYVGNDQFIHAPSSGGKVRVESMDTPYWRARFVKARRWTIPAKDPVANSG